MSAQTSFLAPYASHAEQSRGRFHAEAESKTRSAFQRDRDRVLHAGAFRRLKHKTQVFIAHMGDNYRTRLTHSLEVAQIARTLARRLRVDEDLTETLALAHDLGHPPFGHAGETALHKAMQPFDGFDHNAQSLRILTHLEHRYIGFDGLNLCWETLEGLAKHNGPLLTHDKALADLPFAFREYAKSQDLELDTWPGLEAQIAALADDIAYNNHDIDDAMCAHMISFQDLDNLSLTGRILHDIKADYGEVSPTLLRHEMIRRLISTMIHDMVQQTTTFIEELAPQHVDDIRAAKKSMVGFSSELYKMNQEIKDFLNKTVYKHHNVNRSMNKAKRVVSDLFAIYLENPILLPVEWQLGADGETHELARVICDYIAGMTDRFAIEEHRRLFAIDDMLL